jgi:hypothetical protein
MAVKHPPAGRGLELFSKNWERAHGTLGNIAEAAGMRTGSR